MLMKYIYVYIYISSVNMFNHEYTLNLTQRQYINVELRIFKYHFDANIKSSSCNLRFIRIFVNLCENNWYYFY